MLREIAHFIRHVPSSARLKRHSTHAELYDAIMGRAEDHGMASKREWLTAGLQGAVLEVGCGTGLTFSYYNANARVTAVEPSDAFREVAEVRARDATAKIDIVAACVEDAELPPNSFDAAVIAFVLCSTVSVTEALIAIHRALKPGAVVRLIEHVRSDKMVPAGLMHACNPLWKLANGQGCNMNRVVLPHLEEAGFEVLSKYSEQLWSPGIPAFPIERIEARTRPDPHTEASSV